MFADLPYIIKVQAESENINIFFLRFNLATAAQVCDGT
jgi:hypothetical protein